MIIWINFVPDYFHFPHLFLSDLVITVRDQVFSNFRQSIRNPIWIHITSLHHCTSSSRPLYNCLFRNHFIDYFLLKIDRILKYAFRSFAITRWPVIHWNRVKMFCEARAGNPCIENIEINAWSLSFVNLQINLIIIGYPAWYYRILKLSRSSDRDYSIQHKNSLSKEL